MDKAEVKTIINHIIDAARSNCGYLRDHLNREDPNDHSYIELFQHRIRDYLAENTTYKWKVEHKRQRRIEEDSVDIMGTYNNQPSFIIEIDASRGDQVAKKLLSRIDLWGLQKPIHYIALLYPDTQYGKVQSEKFVRYGNDILNKIQNESSVSGIYLDPSNMENVKIEYWDFSKKKFKIDDQEFGSIIDCAKGAIKKILGSNCNFAKAKDIFNKKNSTTFVKKEPGKSKHNRLDGTDIFVFTQWREYGPEWKLFKKICRENGCCIENKWSNRAE